MLGAALRRKRGRITAASLIPGAKCNEPGLKKPGLLIELSIFYAFLQRFCRSFSGRFIRLRRQTATGAQIVAA